MRMILLGIELETATTSLISYVTHLELEPSKMLTWGGNSLLVRGFALVESYTTARIMAFKIRGINKKLGFLFLIA